VLVHTFTSDEKIDADQAVERMGRELAHKLLNIGMKEAGAPLFLHVYAEFLAKYGFAWWGDTPPAGERDRKFRVYCMEQYMKALGRGILQSLLETRVELEAERVRHERGS